MTINELKPGYVVRYRNGKTRMVMPTDNRYILVEMESKDPLWTPLSCYHENLTCSNAPEYDIMEVYGCSISRKSIWVFNRNDRKLLWVRKEKKKYTYAQLREILGEEFEVVG